ncbi:tRNA epoxyqueuosine(34) reductase QueG [Altererythrobacter aurantiacus]|uniref:Epoxyqueuosine reductase n=1 Tax=Parapontixanthobacter aurantiacus TaxID=1463599 RepID=A0A844ZFH1_9SPHN|nr:tRNA epoxyqueuosine(34) reductase QueG [Parapontixanthobacter aurantiacus]MXO86063.1 tRNA epoxyqueuosine(34) reductase QueG [Parapontixanthobacter aurantiacus]
MVNPALITQLQQFMQDEAAQLGFSAIGFASAETDEQRSANLFKWLDEGHHASMEWMEARADQRDAPRHLWPDARSVVALGMSYTPAEDPLALENAPEKARISVYSQGADYHDVVKKALKSLARSMMSKVASMAPSDQFTSFADVECKVFVDTAPVMEKPLGEAAGIGWQGKHTNLVSTAHGSWLFLGAIYTNIPFEPSRPHADRCGSCRRCQDACPTDAFPQSYRLDARRCISYLTIEHKGPIPHEFRKAIGNRIYGCDDCLAVCPWNKFADTAARHRKFLPRAELAAPAIGDFLDLDDAAFRQLFSGSPIKRIGRDRFVRNCLVAAGNSGEPALLDKIERLTRDANPVVAEAARWAKGELTASP